MPTKSKKTKPKKVAPITAKSRRIVGKYYVEFVCPDQKTANAVIDAIDDLFEIDLVDTDNG